MIIKYRAQDPAFILLIEGKKYMGPLIQSLCGPEMKKPPLPVGSGCVWARIAPPRSAAPSSTTPPPAHPSSGKVLGTNKYPRKFPATMMDSNLTFCKNDIVAKPIEI
jgi:hypothetical protein